MEDFEDDNSRFPLMGFICLLGMDGEHFDGHTIVEKNIYLGGVNTSQLSGGLVAGPSEEQIAVFNDATIIMQFNSPTIHSSCPRLESSSRIRRGMK
jgi:hypothetical protein